MAALKYWVWLQSKAGISASAAVKLIRAMGSPEKIFFAEEPEYELAGMDKKSISLLMDKSLSGTYRILDNCQEMGINIIAAGDSQYPERLKNIFDPPVVLYVKGKLPVLDEEAAVAVAGTRKCTPYGLKAAEKIGYELAREGCLVVSGLAKGIDSAAAKGALRGGGKVVGVVGSGPDIVYPVENARLFEDVCAEGAIISEYPPKTEVRSTHFPARNRIISGVSAGLVIIEAPKRSGSLITAARALEQGRDVFAVPANVDSPASFGSNMLIKDGAIPVFSGKDVADEYRMLYPDKLGTRRENVELDKKLEEKLIRDEMPKKKEKVRASKKVIDKEDNGDYDLKKQKIPLSGDEAAICKVIGSEKMHVNDIIEQSGMPTGKVMAILTMLEIKGAAVQEKGKYFKLTN